MNHCDMTIAMTIALKVFYLGSSNLYYIGCPSVRKNDLEKAVISSNFWTFVRISGLRVDQLGDLSASLVRIYQLFGPSVSSGNNIEFKAIYCYLLGLQHCNSVCRFVYLTTRSAELSEVNFHLKE
uniref:Uncharacterized protein n=1 Tax=Glossina austeni TaxID=7395 RepID=A0A1A9UXE2_GLOAU